MKFIASVSLLLMMASYSPGALADATTTNIELYIESDGSEDLGAAHFADHTKLQEALERLGKKQPNIDVHVRGDKTANFERIGHIIVLIQKSGIKFAALEIPAIGKKEETRHGIRADYESVLSVFSCWLPTRYMIGRYARLHCSGPSHGRIAVRSILALISSAFLTTSLLSTPVVAHPSPASSGPSKGSEFALECALGFGSTTCAKRIPNACYVKSADYLGRNAGGADIYEVHYLHENRAYGVAPDPDGKASHYLIVETDPYWVKRTISSPAAPILIYSRPENSPVNYAGDCGMGGTI